MLQKNIRRRLPAILALSALTCAIGTAYADRDGNGRGNDRDSDRKEEREDRNKSDRRVLPGYIERLEIVSSQPAFGGAVPAGAAGPYTVITAIAHGKLNPKARENEGIVDLKRAPVDANGLVSYSTDVVILRPTQAADGRRVLFYEVVNRGNKLGLSSMIGASSLSGAAPSDKFPSILRQGYTVVWSGWQGSVAQTGNGAFAPLGTKFPIAKKEDGTSITGLSREEFIPDYAGGTPTRINLGYAPASLTDFGEVTFNARQSWLNRQGKMDYNSASTPVTTWSYVDNLNGTYSVSFTPPDLVPDAQGNMVPPDAGTIYSFVYRAKDPMVNGVGFAAVRDLVTFLKRQDKDAAGNPNPLADMKTAACALTRCEANPKTNFDVALMTGISQSGRFTRDFLYQGFNNDGFKRPVFEGMLPIIPAGRLTWLNDRFSQVGRWSKQHEDHWMKGDQFPFAFNVLRDPLTGNVDGLLKKCADTETCPKIMQLDGSFEWWGGRASLVTTDGFGRDLRLPSSVRYYLVAGTQHNGSSGVSTGLVTQPAPGATCQMATSPVALAPVQRALIPALESWVARGVQPPASSYPRASDGTAVSPVLGRYAFPDLSNVSVPNGPNATPTPLSLTYGGIYNQAFVTDYDRAVPRRDLSREYTQVVPKVDFTGNEVSGILPPEVQAPLGTYTGWNVRAAGHAKGESCLGQGGVIPFAASAATKSPFDPRPSLDQLYRGRADYAARVGAAADGLVRQGYLTQLDADNFYKANATLVSPKLIPNP